MKIAYADCFSGISGDMFLAALLDAGLTLETLRDGIDRLGLPEKVELLLTETRRGPMRAASLEVGAADSVAERGLHDMLAMLERSRLSDGVKAAASRVFTFLAEAEARVHGEPVEQVHFHEVGAMDSIVDIVGAAIGLEALGIERLYASPLPYGTGSVESRHGRLPLPAPATLELMRMAKAPLVPVNANVELVTPTGAAILCGAGHVRNTRHHDPERGRWGRKAGAALAERSAPDRRRDGVRRARGRRGPWPQFGVRRAGAHGPHRDQHR